MILHTHPRPCVWLRGRIPRTMKAPLCSAGCVLRPCAKTDVHAVHELQEAWKQENITYGFTPASLATIEGALGPFFHVAEVNDRIIGFVAATVREGHDISLMPDEAQYLEVDDLYVLPEYRGQGIGKQLLDAALQAARERGIRKAFIYSSTKDLFRAMRFYQNAGFQPWFARMFCDL